MVVFKTDFAMKMQIVAALLLSLVPLLPAAAETPASAPQPLAADPASSANNAPNDQPSESWTSRWRLGAAFGYGFRTNPLLQSDDIPIIVDLDIAWFGDHFFFDNGDLGLTFLDNDFLTTSLVARVNSDRVFFGRTDTKFVRLDIAAQPIAMAEEITIPDRDYAAELGIEALADVRKGFLQLSAYHDVGGTHNGFQVGVDYRYGWRHQRFYLEPSLGLTYKSANLNDYYWGVRPGEISPLSPGYEVGSGVNLLARLQLSYQISRNWSFSFIGEVERLSNEAAGSPIVADQNVYGYFAGFGYRFR